MTNLYDDGSTDAPAGTPLLATLLNGYAAIPPWEVAGANYAVGVPSATTLLDPSTIAMAGVSVNAANHTITITGSNVTLNGYDFGLAGGWGIYIEPGATNTVIENSHFLVGANKNVPVNAAAGAGNLTVQDDTFDGGGGTSGAVWAMVNYNGSGTFVAKYDSFLNTPSDAIDFSSGTMTTIVEYNVFENLGTAPGAHADTVQYNGVKSNNSVIAFNTVTSGEEGIQLCAQGNGSTLTNTTIDNNVILAKGPAISISYSIALQEAPGDTINGAVVDDNYLDTTGSYGPFYPPAGTDLTFAGNVNVKTGAKLASPSGTSSSDVSSVTATPASGTEAAGATITISLHMDETELVTGTPTLTLNNGGTASYVSGSGSTTLVFSYTVSDTGKTEAALAITGVTLAKGASITDPYGNEANLGGAVATFTGLGITAGKSVPTPVTVADDALTPENKAVTIAVLANDSAGGGTINPASVAVSTATEHGNTSVNPTTGAITYTPTTGYYGTDRFKYTVADTDGVAATPTTVTVVVDAPPTTVADAASTQENRPVSITVLANDSDVDGTINAASVAISTAAGHGTTRVNTTTGAITYTPASGFTGTDTFQYTVADTKGVTSAPATVTVTPSRTTTGYVDGSAGAPAGSPQLPSILSGYAVRPPWEVAGVDYAVGVPAGTALLNPATISLAGVSVSTSNHTVTITGNNVTLSGYNFGNGNGYEVIVEGANDAIRNSDFVVGSDEGSLGTVLDVTRSASNFSLLDNEINGNNVAVTAQQGSTVSIASSGTLTMQYNYFHNSGGDMIDLNASTAAQIDLIKYNLFENVGVNTAHADTIQWYNTTTGAGSDIGFNTIYQTVPQPGAGNGALVPLAEGSQATMTGLTVNNDTIIQTAADDTANFTTGFYEDMGGTASDIVIHDLYVDPTGVMEYTGSPWFPNGYYDSALAHPTAMSNVIDMVTGAQVPVPSASSKTSQGYYTSPDTSGYSPSLSDVWGVTASPARGTYDPGSIITFTIALDEAFTVTGTPKLILNNGGIATYSGGSGTSSLIFTYKVAQTDTTVSTLAIKAVNLPAGAMVKDSVGNEANLAGAVTTFPGLGIDPPGAGETATPQANTYYVTAATVGALSVPDDSDRNTLIVNGGGTVTMPSTLVGIDAVQLTAPTSFTANATADLQITGSAAGEDKITLGSATQSVVGGGANERVVAAAADAGDRVSGLGTNSALEVTSGGTITLNAATDVRMVQLDAASTLILNAMSFISATGTVGGDSIRAGGAYQVLTGGMGDNSLIGSDAGHDTFRNTAAGLDGDIITNFVHSDAIDVTGLAFAGASLHAVVNGDESMVTLTSGTTATAFTMAGARSSSDFHLKSDGKGGTVITYSGGHA